LSDESFEGGCACRSVRYKGQVIARCPNCHIALWSNYGGVGDVLRFVRVGTLDEPGRMPPDIHIFTSTRQPWVKLDDGKPVYKEYYKSAEVWPKESLERRAKVFPPKK